MLSTEGLSPVISERRTLVGLVSPGVQTFERETIDHPDASYVMVGPMKFHGRDDLVKRLLAVYLRAVEDVKVTPLTLAVLGEIIVEQGPYSYEAGETRRGVYSQTWVKQQDGSWKIQTMLVVGVSGLLKLHRGLTEPSPPPARRRCPLSIRVWVTSRS